MRVDLPSGIHLNVHSAGAGEHTALLIHGWAVSGDIWSPVLNAWPADGPRLLAPDLRGTGWSSKPQSGYTLDAYAEDIVGLIDALGLRDLVLVGHSMGGTIAMKVALARPQQLRRLVLISPVPAAGVPFKDEDIAFFRSLGGSQAGAEQTLGMMMASRPSQAAFERGVLGMASVVSEAFFGGFDAWRTANFADQVGKISAPTLVLGGEREQPLSPEVLQAAVVAPIPGARFELLPGVSHYPQLECTEHITARLRALIDGE
jgi:pimeloyl-ACP methyl ester carboxylesterase